jgi:hypothetical protein
MSLEQTGSFGRVFRRTAAVKSLDPTEKGAVNYFLGMAVAKLFAADLLATPWLLHLDVFRPQLDAVLTGRSRPDLVGQLPSGDWIALECKGRASEPNDDAKTKAKAQAQRIVSVGGTPPAFAIGAITYFQKDSLHFFWRDPQIDPSVKNRFSVEPSDRIWDHYYALILGLMRVADHPAIGDVVWAKVDEADVEIGVHSAVWRLLQKDAAEAKRAAEELKGQLGPCNADGIVVRAGPSWMEPLADAAVRRR